MQIRHSQTVVTGGSNFNKVTALAWSPNGQRLAVVTINRVVLLFNESGELKDKFSTKPADSKGSKSYIVTSMVFSPDSSKLAIGQSDDIVFIYKLGLEWGEKKTICNKFQEMCSVVKVLWPSQHQHEMLFGLSDGKVKMGQLKTNRSITVYAGCSSVVSLACSPDGSACVVGHLDGSIYRFMLNNSSPGLASLKIATYGGIPLILSWGRSVVAAGPDCKVTLYDPNGGILHEIDCGNIQTQELSSGCFNPNGDMFALGHFSGVNIFRLLETHNGKSTSENKAQNMYAVSALAWKPDGSQLATSSLCGRVDVFDVCIRKQLYLGKFDITYVSKSQVSITHLASRLKCHVGSQFGLEILKLNIYKDQYLVAHTSETVLVGNLPSATFSEVPWSNTGHEKFLFDNPLICMIYNDGELSIVEYGCNEVLATCRTDYISPSLVSVRLRFGLQMHEEIKAIAYLIDLQTIKVLDLLSGATITTVNNDSEIKWLGLNQQISYLLFHDKEHHLYLLNLQRQEKMKLLNTCSFVDWVPSSDVVVAQSQSTLYVWYSIQNAEHPTVFQIKGDIEAVDRAQGRTEVIVNEGMNTVSYVLDEALMDFGLAVESLQYKVALSILEPLELTSEVQAMWKQLGDKALNDKELIIAERCFAALGDVSKSRYLHKINKLVEATTEEMGIEGLSYYTVKAKLALLHGQWKHAEAILLEHGCVAEAIQMYTECQKWRDAIRVAVNHNYPDAYSLRTRHYKWLLETGQYEEAGKLKEEEGDISGAINIFLRGGLPGHAAECVISHAYPVQKNVSETIAEGLIKGQMFEKAGDFLERLEIFDRAKDCYKKGHCYAKAVDLAHRQYPKEVASLEQQWGDWLVSQNQIDIAINHFVDAGCSGKAIEAAISSFQWSKALQIVEAEQSEVKQCYLERLARHFEAIKSYAAAEKLFIKAKIPNEAIEMYIRGNKWEAAHQVAMKYLSQKEAENLCLRRATELESLCNYKDAEKLFLQVREHDSAINMYKKARMFDQMIRLVKQYRKDLLVETHLDLAQQLEHEGSLREAEQHYLEAEDWRSVLKMFRARGMWEDAMRIAKLFGGLNGAKQVAYAWAMSLGGESGAQLLAKLGLVEQAVEYALDTCSFDYAFDLCNYSLKHKIPEVHLKFAMFLEDEGRFGEAEDEFVKAGKPREAIEMYVHQQDWQAAIRVADLYDPSSICDVQVSQAEHLMKKNDLLKAEALFIKARRPELAVKMYKDKLVWEDALRVAEKHIPLGISDIHDELAAFMQRQNGGLETFDGFIARATAMEHNKNYSDAIDIYLQLDNNHTDDLKQLHQVWERAINLAKTYVQARVTEVVETVANRFVASEHYDKAADLYQEIDSHKEAVEMCIMAGLWDKARKIAAASSHQVQQHVDNLYKQHLMRRGEADRLVEIGKMTEAMELYIQQSNWDKVHELATLLGPEKEKEMSLKHAKQCIQEMKVFEATSILAQFGAPGTSPSYELCCFIGCQLLSSNEESSIMERSIQDFRSVLYQLMTGQAQPLDSSSRPVFMEVERLFLVAHYTCLRMTVRRKDLSELVAKLSVSLLRYVGLVPADKAFYEAGIFCKQIGWQNMAFVYLNNYLDIADAIESQDGGTAMDTSGLDTSDIPQEFPIPVKQFLNEEKREQVRDWVIQLSMDQKVEPTLSTRQCENCGNVNYVASLTCFSCKVESKACCVTGYPILEEINCKFCGCSANKEDWNTFVQNFQICPWCHESQSPIYS